jgi:hypothetical protein
MATGILLLGFQNCGQNNVNFNSTNEKVATDAIEDTIVICNDLNDCRVPPSQDNVDPDDPVSSPSTSRNTPNTSQNQNRKDKDEDCNHKDLVCGGYSTSDLVDAVIVVRKIVIVSHDDSVEIDYQGPVSLNGFEIEIPAALSGKPVGVRLDIAETGHHFITKDGNQIEMDALTALKSDRRSFKIDVTSTPDGAAYLLSTDWSSRIHPGKNHCGLLPLENSHRH